MSGIVFIRDLAVVLLVAGGVAWLCQRLRLSVVVGYLVAGAVIGPYTPPFALVSDLDRVQTLAQLGLSFLIFSIGLNLSLSRLKRLGLSLVVATAIGALLVLNGCRLFGLALGWSGTASLFLAGMLMVSSSAIIGRVLDEQNLTHERPGQLALGVTVIEDVVAVTMLTLLTSLVQFGGGQRPPLLATVGSLGAFVVFLALLSLLMAPRLLASLSRNAQPEIRTLIVVGLLLAAAWLAVQAGYSLALGAFVFGAIIGSTRYKADIERAVGGLQQTFGAVFFVAVGMQVDFRSLADAVPLMLAVTALALVLRPLACALGLLAVGNTGHEAIRAGLALTPLGEFSFIIAQLGVGAGVVPPALYPVAVGASLLTSLAAPVLTRRAEALSQWVVKAEPRRVRQWVSFYHDWLGRLRHLQTASVVWRLTKGRLVQVAVQVLFVSAVILFTNPIYAKLRAAVGDDWVSARGTGFLFWSVFGVLLLGPLIAIWRNVSALAMILAEGATAGAAHQPRLQRLLETALRIVALALLLGWLLAVLPPGWSLVGPAGAVLALLVAVAVGFWRRFVRLHSRLEIELLGQLERASRATSTSAWSLALPRQSADWDLDIDEVTLAGDSAHAGRTVGQLALRQRFGCSLIGIDRHGHGIVNPGADTVLYPLDRLLLLGPPQPLALAARELGNTVAALEGPAGFEELTMEGVVVPEGSPLAGQPLSALDLIRRVGVQIGGIRRGAAHRVFPSAADRFEAGDELLVLGTHAQIRQFRLTLAGGFEMSAG